MTSIIHIHPGGRGAYLLARYLGRKPAGEPFRSSCVRNLASPVHAHIDYQGNYLTGFCNGQGFHFSEFYPDFLYEELKLVNRGRTRSAE